MRTRALLVLSLMAPACSDDDEVGQLPDAPFLVDATLDGADDAPADGADDVELRLERAGNGSGTITSSPDGILCGAECTAAFPRDTVVTLTAVPDAGSGFAGWSGACTGTTPTCEVALADVSAVTATFTLARYAVTVTRSGAGTGTVAGGGVQCGATCAITVEHGTALTLAATPGALSTFAGWGGACTGTSTCVLTVTADTAITASFALDDLTLFVTRAGGGTGTVTSSPAGINCGTDCDQTYSAGQSITLAAAPAASSIFVGWSGTCTGTGACVVTMTAARTVTATFTLRSHTLDVARAGTGSGTVASMPAGIDCGTACSTTYQHGTIVTLTATPATGSTFTGWSGACTGTAACTVTMDAARTVAATFTLQNRTLTVTRSGNGTVTGTGIDCGSDCSQAYPFGTTVTLTATPATGSSFTGWSGACTGTGACTVTMDAARTVGATFALMNRTLTVTRSGNGTVTGTGIDCGSDCSQAYPFGTIVTLTATPATGSTFTGWSGACTGTGACTVTMDAARTVGATFALQNRTLTVTRTGNGLVTGSGIDCGTDCSQAYPFGTIVTLTATPATGSTFTGWSGACTGTGACTVTMDAALTVGATFTLQSRTLTVTRSGNGSVTGTGIDCGSDCSQAYPFGTLVTLTATPAAGSTFAGWSGACTGTGACTITMDATLTVGATFVVENRTLTVTRSGNGTVTGAGIDCGSDCSQAYPFGTLVTLTATAAADSTFAGWSGACTGTGACTITMDAIQTVSATFTLVTHTLIVTRIGDGAGTVTGPGIDCGADCAESFPRGTSVTLTASPSTSASTLSTFAGWSGACSGTGPCTIVLGSDATVGAIFTLAPNLVFVTSGEYSGDLGGLAGADATCQAHAAAANLPGTYRAYLSSVEGNSLIHAPARMGSASGWVRVDGGWVINSIDQLAAGALFNAPRLTEVGQDVGQTQTPYAWTGTNASGQFHSVCTAAEFAPWMGAFGTAMAGLATSTSSSVVALDNHDCQSARRLYCFGVDRAAVLQ